MADIIVRDLDMGLYEAELVSHAVRSYLREKLGSDPVSTIEVDNDELWLLHAAAWAEGFTVEFEGEEWNWGDDDLGIQYDL